MKERIDYVLVHGDFNRKDYYPRLGAARPAFLVSNHGIEGCSCSTPSMG
jgi:hypothetical protein